MEHVEESVYVQQWRCSKCDQLILDENEYLDNDGVCDTCYSLSFKRRIGLLK